MTITTIATHNPSIGTLTDPVFINKLNEMVAAGKTDGQYTQNEGPYPPRIVTRIWTTMAAAEEWQQFMLTTFADQGVVSVEIQET